MKIEFYRSKQNLMLLVSFIMMAMVGVGCSHQESDVQLVEESDVQLVESSLLEQVYYLQEADSIQPSWLQREIVENPYLIVYRNNDEQNYLLEFPEKALFKLYKNGTFQNVKSEDLDKIIVSANFWTCTHIYSFPLYPGYEEWNFNKYSVNQIKEKLLLPNHLLKTMRTADLLEVCLDYPYMLDFAAYDDLQKGFDYLCAEFNGYNELLQRQDLNQAMLKKQAVYWRKTEKIKSLSDIEKGKYNFQCTLFKMILAQDKTLDSFNVSQLRQMIDLSFININLEKAKPEIFGTFNKISTLYLCTRIIQRQGGFYFESDEERQLFELFASTCTCNPKVLAVFTEELQQRMSSFLLNI
ncbi:MAG: hypothetical protein IKS94_02470 [Prevotella sp.]|nr:hypothetical protein [Prevotella sp.]